MSKLKCFVCLVDSGVVSLHVVSMQAIVVCLQTHNTLAVLQSPMGGVKCSLTPLTPGDHPGVCHAVPGTGQWHSMR